MVSFVTVFNNKVYECPLQLHTHTSAVDDALWWPNMAGRLYPTPVSKRGKEVFSPFSQRIITRKLLLNGSMLKKSDRLKIAVFLKKSVV